MLKALRDGYIVKMSTGRSKLGAIGSHRKYRESHDHQWHPVSGWLRGCLALGIFDLSSESLPPRPLFSWNKLVQANVVLLPRHMLHNYAIRGQIRATDSVLKARGFCDSVPDSRGLGWSLPTHVCLVIHVHRSISRILSVKEQ